MPAKKRMIRNKQVVRKLPPKAGYRAEGNRYVKINGGDRVKLHRAAIKSARARKGKGAQISRARSISLRIRKARGIGEEQREPFIPVQFDKYTEWLLAVKKIDPGCFVYIQPEGATGTPHYAEAYESEDGGEPFAEWTGEEGFIYDDDKAEETPEDE